MFVEIYFSRAEHLLILEEELKNYPDRLDLEPERFEEGQSILDCFSKNSCSKKAWAKIKELKKNNKLNTSLKI